MSAVDHSITHDCETALACPRCREPLQEAVDERTKVDYCDRCKGVWVDFINEKEVLGIKPASFTIDELQRFRKLYKPFGRVEDARYVPCPVCRQMMYRKIWGSHSGVMVDRCMDHGTWFDPGEIEKIREYVALGGVEYEKLRLIERGLIEFDKVKETVHRWTGFKKRPF
jgi:Zn-finger nucleic acid-binding protein